MTAPIFLHGALRRLCDYYVAPRHRARRARRRHRSRAARRRDFAGADRARPALGLRGRLGPALRRPAGRLRLRLDAGPRPRPPARRRAAAVISDHCDWTELTATIAELAPAEVWVTHGREEALVRWCALQRPPGAAAAPRRLRRRGRRLMPGRTTPPAHARLAGARHPRRSTRAARHRRTRGSRETAVIVRAHGASPPRSASTRRASSAAAAGAAAPRRRLSRHPPRACRRGRKAGGHGHGASRTATPADLARAQAALGRPARPRESRADAPLRRASRPPRLHPRRATASCGCSPTTSRATPDPDRGWGLAAITRDLDLDAVKPAMLRGARRGARRCRAFRALLRLRRRPRRDHRADLARPAGARPTTRRSARSSTRLHAASRREAPQVVERLLDRARRLRPLRAPQARHRRPARRRLGPARQAGARRPRRRATSPRSRSSGTGWRRPTSRSSPGSTGAGPQPVSAAGARLPPGRCWPMRWSDGRLRPPRPRRLRRRVEMGRHPRPGRRRGATSRRLYSRTGDDISGAFPDLARRPRLRRARSTANCWSAARTAAIAPFSDLQQRLNRKTVTAAQLRRLPRPPPRLRPAAATASDDLRALPFAERRARARGRSPPRSTRRASTSRRCSPFADLGRPRRPARRAARPGDRGRDAQAPRQPLRARPAQGPVVEVEARPAHRSTRC